MGNFDRKRSFYRIFKMDVTIWLSVLLAVITLGTPASSSEPRVVCYYTNWSVYRPGTARFNPQNINPYLCTHLIYAFGGFTKDNTLKPFDKYQDIEKGGYAKFTGLKTYNKELKTLLAIGGWNEGSSRFSPMVASRERRKEFVRNAIKFLRQNRFDGLDLDWEYPAFRDGGKPKDREHYAKLVKELREEFERESQKTGKPRLLLTMAVPAGIEYIEKGFDVKTLNQYLDWMNLLTYDYHSAFEPAVNHHAPLYPLEEPNEYSVDNELNIDYTIKFYLENGADADKLVLGIPTYGRSYTLFNPDAVEIGSPADGPGDQGDATREKGYLAYYEICEALIPKEKKKRSQSEEDSEEYEDEEEEPIWTVMYPNTDAMGPVAYKGNQWVGYDDVDIVKKKAHYVAENGLGGIMFWSIDNDDFRGVCHGKPYPLIEAAKQAYFESLGSTTVVKKTKPAASRPITTRKKTRPRSSTTTTTERTTKPSKRVSSTTPSWNVTPEPPTTPDPGSDFKCVDEGFYPHPRDCKKYFWCLDSGPSNLGIVAHQFTCPSGLYFNKAADSCDFARNVPCKKSAATTKAPTTKPATTKAPSTTTTTTTTTTRRPIRLSTKSTSLFRTTRTTSTTTPKPEPEEEYEEDVVEDGTDEDAEDPRVIKELIDLIKKVGGIEQLEKQLGLGESSASTGGAVTTTPASFNKKLYQKVLERTRGRNKNNSIFEIAAQNIRRGPQNAGIEATNDRDKLLKRDRPQYTTINRQRSSSTTEAPSEAEESDEEEEEEEVAPVAKVRTVESRPNVATTAKPLQYVNIRRGKPTTESLDNADDSASRNALYERTEALVSVSDAPESFNLATLRRENIPEYVTIRRQRPTTEETTTVQYQNDDEEDAVRETALEREISTQPQYSTIVRSRSTIPPEEPNTAAPINRVRSTILPTEDPTTVLDVQISSFLNSPSTSELDNPETEPPVITTEIADPPTTTTTTTTPSSSTRRINIIRRRGSTTTAAPAPSTTSQGAKRTFLRRTKATSPPDTTEPTTATDNSESTNKFTRRGNSKFKLRREQEKNAQKNEIEIRRPSLTGGTRLSERPPSTRGKFVSRRRLGGANSNTTASLSTTIPSPTSTVAPVSSTTRRGFRIGNRRRPLGTSTTTAPTTTTPVATTNSYEDESVQEIGDTDAIEDPSLEPKTAKKTDKIQRRPLTILKDEVKDQNPSATNEEENKRQSKKYSSSIKKNDLDELVKKSQEETSTENKTTVEDFSPETAVAIAVHNLITAPIPGANVYDGEDIKPTRKTQTTVEYKYSSREYNAYTDSRTPTYDSFQSTPSLISTINNDETTAYKNLGFDTTKVSASDSTKDSDSESTIVTNSDSTKDDKLDVTDFTLNTNTAVNKYITTPQYKTIGYGGSTADNSYSSDFDSSKISTFDVPNPTTFPNTATNQEYVRTTSDDYTVDTPRSTPTPFALRQSTTDNPSNTATGRGYFRSTLRDLYDTRDEFDSKFTTYISKTGANSYPANTVTQNYVRSTVVFPETSTEYSRNYSPYVPRFTATDSFPATLTEINLSRNAVLTPSPTPSKNLESTDTLVENTARTPSSFSPRSTEASRVRAFRPDLQLDIATAGYSGIQRGGRFRNEKRIPVDNSGLSTVSYSGSSQEPSYFTREYLLESPVTKSYDEEFQYISPVTTPQTPAPTVTRRIIRKKIQRKISTTQRPTTAAPTPSSTTTIRPRRIPAKPFEKVSTEPKRKYRPIANYDYYDDTDEKMATKYVEGTKVVMHKNGNIECLDIGNFPHPSSCKKFISCARIDNGSLLGWEYVCPKGLSFDPVGGICNWSAGLGCNEKDV